ncbi:MAG: hypothetical protein D6785_06365, partial [Planctomycetota bacterium]
KKLEEKGLVFRELCQMEEELKVVERALQEDWREFSRRKEGYRKKKKGKEEEEKEIFSKREQVKALEKQKKEWLEKKEEILKGLDELAVQIDQKERVLKKMEEEKAEKEDKPLLAWQEWEKEKRNLETRIPKIMEERGNLREDWRVLVSALEGKETLKEDLENLERRIRSEFRKVEAIRTLYLLYKQLRESQNRSLGAGLEREINDLVTQVFPRKYSLSFSSTGKLTSLQAHELNEKQETSFSLLSFGAKEQILLFLRLGLCKLISKDEEVLLVLDDPLANTDPLRSEKILSLLEEMGRKNQILLMTCHPENFRSLDCHRIDLAKVKNENGDG